MEFGIIDFLKIIGALALFIFGMKIMSEGIQKAAGSQLRSILRFMTRNRLIGIFSGFFITAIVQSSSATTVMIVSFANAGMLTLTESIWVIMGANIGTTLKAWLISIFGFKINISDFSLPLMAIGLPLLFVKRTFIKNIGEAIMGFAILFLGLFYLKESVPDLQNNAEALSFLAKYTDYGILSTILFVGVGTILTAIIQSSSAAMALTLILLFKGVINFEVAAAMCLGENIGTTITANLAALVGNVHAKRAARAHFVFNVLGVIWMVLIFSFFINLLQSAWNPFQGFLQTLFPNLNLSQGQNELQLALFHTAFNLLNTLLLMWFIPVIVIIVTKMVPARGEEDEEFRLEYINTTVKTPELSILEAQREVAKYGQITSRMSDFTQKLLLSTDINVQSDLLKRLEKYEKITDKMEIEITEFLTKISGEELSNSLSVRIRSIMNICNDLERIGDIFYQMSKNIERKIDDKIWFNQHQRDRLNEMFHLVNQAFKIMQDNLNAEHYHKVTKDAALEAERKINNFRNILRQENVAHMESRDGYNINSAVIYSNLFSSLERIGDHIINVTESIVGEI